MHDVWLVITNPVPALCVGLFVVWLAIVGWWIRELGRRSTPVARAACASNVVAFPPQAGPYDWAADVDEHGSVA